MKFKLFVILANFFFIIFAQAQGIMLPIDSANKRVTYYEVVKLDSTQTQTQIFLRAEKWIDQNLKLTEIKPDSFKILATGSITLTQQKGILEKNAGTVTYDALIESRNGRYRYIFTNFVYHKITQDRYGKKQSETKKPLEDVKAAGWGKQWNRYKAIVNMRINSLINDMKIHLKQDELPVIKKIEKKSSDW